MSAPPTSDTAAPTTKDGKEPIGTLGWLGFLLVGIPVAGLLALVAYSFTMTSREGGMAFAVGCGAIGGAGAVGALLGFLFGIPRSLQDSKSEKTRTDGSTYGVNTNLEQISDWLTKILVGVGLVEIKQLGGPMRHLVGAVGGGMGDTEAARVVAGTLLIVFVIWGFLVSYLITRTQAARAFRESDVQVITQRAVEQVTETLGKQADQDARLLGLIDMVLNPGADTSPPDQDVLDDAMTAASITTRIQAFLQACRQRRANWKADKKRMAATMPVFRALIAADVDAKYHRNHGQLGYALKDLEQPRWQEAFDALSTAIARRKGGGYVLYEFNRAIAGAQLIAAGTPPPSADQLLDNDLGVVAAKPKLMETLIGEPAVAHWIDEHHWQRPPK